jgi:hypothetical protein
LTSSSSIKPAPNNRLERLGMSFSRVERGTPATVVIGKIAFEFSIPILLGGDVLGVMEFFSFTI